MTHFHACDATCGFQADVVDKVELDAWVNNLLKRIPESWDGEGSPESIVSEYLHELERRVLALGGSLEKHDEATR
jgi:hypothetical protein